MNINLSLTLILVLANAILGFFIVFRDIKNIKNRSFGLLILAIIFWILANYFANIKDYNIALLWNRIAYASSILIPYFIFEISVGFAEKFKIPNWQRILLLIPTIIVFYLCLFTSYIVQDIKLVDYGSEPILAKTFSIHPIFFVLIAIFIGVILFKQYRLSHNSLNKYQLRYFTLAIFLSLFFGFLFNVVLPLILHSYAITIYGTLSTLFLIGFTAYAITKHHLFDIRVIATEILAVLITLGLLLEALLSKSWQMLTIKLLLVTLVSYGGYLLIRSVLDEIKKRKQLQELTNELQIANKRLAELDALKTEFVSMASHELLTPISAIQGYLHMIVVEKIIPLSDSKSEGILRKVYDSSNRLARLVTDLLNVSRIESGRIVLENQNFDINQVIQIAVSELKIKTDEKNLKLLWSPQVEPKVYADKDKLKQVLTNIIGNAIKYTEKGEIEVSTSLEKDKALGTKLEGGGEKAKRIETRGDFVIVHVRDTGVGIPKEEISTIFQKFHRIGDWKTRNTQGTGLGLYIAKNITEMLGGKIWVDSEYGKGSTFSFSVPLKENSNAKAQMSNQN